MALASLTKPGPTGVPAWQATLGSAVTMVSVPLEEELRRSGVLACRELGVLLGMLFLAFYDGLSKVVHNEDIFIAWFSGGLPLCQDVLNHRGCPLTFPTFLLYIPFKKVHLE